MRVTTGAAFGFKMDVNLLLGSTKFKLLPQVGRELVAGGSYYRPISEDDDDVYASQVTPAVLSGHRMK